MMSKWNKVCHTVGMILWLAGAASLLLAWVAGYKKGLVWGLEPLAWYWNALVLGVLGMGARSCKEDGCCMLMEKEM